MRKTRGNGGNGNKPPGTLILRLDAPLVSFGGVEVDGIGPTLPYPTTSMLTGITANALGYRHRDVEKLQRLQERIRFATRCDRPGQEVSDYQTTDLGQDHLLAESVAWTTRGYVDGRKGDKKNQTGTDIRYRVYHADAMYTVALALIPSEEYPTLSELAKALRYPARCLSIGRNCCIPAAPILIGRSGITSPIVALRAWPREDRQRTGVAEGEPLSACWDMEEGEESTTTPVSGDRRDWKSRLCGGRRLVHYGWVCPPEMPEKEQRDDTGNA